LEQVASVLAEMLGKEGIDATLFATGDSITGPTLESVIDKHTSRMNVRPVTEESVMYC
jgi:hypothetical protein